MRIPIVILGVGTCVLSAGAFAGATISTDPVQRGNVLIDQIAERASDGPVHYARRDRPAADHYAMDTPEGRVEVQELAYYGRLRRDLGDGPIDFDAEYPGMDSHGEPAPADASSTSDLAEAPQDMVIAMVNPLAPAQPVAFAEPSAVPPLSQAAPVASSHPAGSSRMVDVDATLAAR